MELREEIAAVIAKTVEETFEHRASTQPTGWLPTADAILSLPRIKEALAYRAELGPINHELRELMRTVGCNPTTPRMTD